MIVTFCGHADYFDDTHDQERLLCLLEEVVGSNPAEIYLGGYGRFDTFAYQCAKKFQTKHPNTKLVFVTPYLNNWLNARRDVIVQLYDDIVYPMLENVPPRFAISRRNEWMIREADYVIFYVCHHFGGAYKALVYAHKLKKRYTNLYQGEFEVF